MAKISAQKLINFNPTKVLINEHNIVDAIPLIKPPFRLRWNQYFYFNSNLPNLENQNGLYLSKGFGSVSGLLFEFSKRNFLITIEPRIIKSNELSNNLPVKEKTFSVLNDVPIKKKNNQLQNVGLLYTNYGLAAGFSNWNQWWGPGIHNSLVLSNNSEGFYHYFIGTDSYKNINSYLQYKFKYFTTTGIDNFKSVDYYLSAWFINIKIKSLEFGTTRNIISGGNKDIKWNSFDAAKVLISNDKIKFWDQIYTNYILYKSSSGTNIFFEWGYPNRSFNDFFAKNNDHARGTNLGMRKHGAFGYDQILFGFEYTRLIQSGYYNLHPSPNWYDNIKYNYYSIDGRRWAAHSGSDSDDLLLFAGYIDERLSIIYGLNYERHGVTYKFPPEVKFESRVSISYKYKKYNFFINYENEYFEHYGFVDNNDNVWSENYEVGSIQRTNTILVSLEREISF